MTSVAIILARSGSKGVPDKNIRFISGIRVSHYAIKAALESDCFDLVVYSSDSEHYLELAQEFYESQNYDSLKSHFVVHKRSEENSNDTASSWSAVGEVCRDKMVKQGDIFLVAATCPSITYTDIRRFSASAVESDSALSVRPIDYPVESTFCVNNDGFVRPHALSSQIKYRQQAAKIFRPDGHLYYRKAKDILRDVSFPDETTKALDLEKNIYLNIDNESDFAFAEAVIS